MAGVSIDKRIVKKTRLFCEFYHAVRSAPHLPFHDCQFSLANGKKIILRTLDVTVLQNIAEQWEDAIGMGY
ncbi:hypothetical protein OI450_17790 [Pectobacterium cacticida]|uniref:Uncharacterized protein n=1 Tax=Pectobacterium cacticida TaxID=69221 RepID=A0ABZ2GBA1_9GAMM|nr:hypothetical protein [Pectobacterium cacticida]UYX06713.1 hypothetical protein OI450_17790 [Pectobacterium cacticida]